MFLRRQSISGRGFFGRKRRFPDSVRGQVFGFFVSTRCDNLEGLG
jgi:hypothetical protein